MARLRKVGPLMKIEVKIDNNEFVGLSMVDVEF